MPSAAFLILTIRQRRKKESILLIPPTHDCSKYMRRNNPCKHYSFQKPQTEGLHVTTYLLLVFLRKGIFMWKNNKMWKTGSIIICIFVVSIVCFGTVIGSARANAATAFSSHQQSASLANRVTTDASTFKVESIDMSVTPDTVSLWKCGSFIQVVYHAVFHVVSGPTGGTLVFSYTTNNGRSQMTEELTILPGQRLSDFTFSWQGSLPADHVYPGPGGVMVTSPNLLVSQLVAPAGSCR